jgi:hypothetical protein
MLCRVRVHMRVARLVGSTVRVAYGMQNSKAFWIQKNQGSALKVVTGQG